MKYKIKTTVLIVLCVLVLVSIGGFNYLVDPYQIYHKSFIHPDQFMTNARYQNAGVTSSYIDDEESKTDSVVIGTSMSQNFSGKYIDKVLGWNSTANLAMSGSTAFEQNMILQKALRTGKIKNVIQGIYFTYDGEVKARARGDYFPVHLYDQSFLNDYEYLLNVSTIDLAIKCLRNKITFDSLEHVYDLMPKWQRQNAFAVFNAPKTLKKLRDQVEKGQKKLADYQLSRATDYPNLDAYIVKNVKQNPDVMFYYFFPPYYTVFYSDKGPEYLNRQISMRRYLVEKLANYPNAKVYAFDNDTKITGDLKHYRDTHYADYVNDSIVDRIAAGEDILTMDTIDEYEQTFVKNIKTMKVYSSFRH